MIYSVIACLLENAAIINSRIARTDTVRKFQVGGLLIPVLLNLPVMSCDDTTAKYGETIIIS